VGKNAAWLGTACPAAGTLVRHGCNVF
jgi:hypothetical protein